MIPELVLTLAAGFAGGATVSALDRFRRRPAELPLRPGSPVVDERGNRWRVASVRYDLRATDHPTLSVDLTREPR